eukprot:TRINITY_DN47262_c0_g1_i1.p1 TRINITY_DN47262_c0_g1~~TRINITY_DN47262_c0_g1_i1.p1  ORF type:complete len:2707 (-),score=546.64 TRINITY_DN47262_c0_g1_i1:209-8329(-)
MANEAADAVPIHGKFTTSDIPLEEVVIVATAAELPSDASAWPVRVILATDCPAGGLPHAYICGSAEKVDNLLQHVQEPVLGTFVDDAVAAEKLQKFKLKCEVLPSLSLGFSRKTWEDVLCAVCSRHVTTIQDAILIETRKHPDKTAVIFKDNFWTYRELMSAACDLRDYLFAENLDPAKGSIAVRMDASDLAIIAYLALLAGRFTIHLLDGSSAGQKYRLSVNHSQAILTCTADAPAPPLELRTIFVDQLNLDASKDLCDLRVDGDVNDVAFIEYTSGSTGVPKATATSNWRISHWSRWHRFHFPPGEGRDAYNMFFIWYWSLPLMTGSTEVVWPNVLSKDVSALMEYFRKHKVNRCNCLTPGQLSVMLEVMEELPPDLKVMISGGEALALSTCRSWLKKWPQVELICNYATTETASDISFIEVDEKVANMDMPFAPIARNIICWNNACECIPLESGEEELVITGWNIAPGYLPPTDSNSFTLDPAGLKHRYRSGDRAKWIDGMLFMLGRIDSVVKIRGFRIDLKGLEALLSSCDEVTDVHVRKQNDALVCMVITRNLNAVKEYAQTQYPHAHLISWKTVPKFPETKSGKKDVAKIKDLLEEMVRQDEETEDAEPYASQEEERVAQAYQEVLGRKVGRSVPFSEAGGHSLSAMKIAKILRLSPAELFKYPTIASLAASISGSAVEDQCVPMPVPLAPAGDAAGPLAVIGMAGRFPSAPSVVAMWEALESGRLMTSAVPGATALHVQRKGMVPDLGLDCGFWKISKEMAVMMDTAQRTMLEVAYEALADAGFDPFKVDGRVGIVVCGGSLTHYAIDDLGIDLEESRTQRADEYFALEVGTDKDYLATQTAFRLNLRGPAEVVQTACSSGLVAIARAMQMLRLGVCDYVLCGGASFTPDAPVRVVDGLIWSPDGICRPFAEGANGTVASDGAGLVVLTRLDAAMNRGQRVYATVLGAATNNDGNRKAGFSAPSFEGQVEVLKAAHADARISGDQLDYVEGHGTGTKLGDPIEVQALTSVIGTSKTVKLGSVKGNLGHLNTAAGVPGFMKAALMLHHQRMVPSLHATSPSRHISWEKTGLRLATQAEHWPGKLAGVSSFGVGGTNVHVVLGVAPSRSDEVKSAVPVPEWKRDSLVEERKALTRRVGKHKVGVIAHAGGNVATPKVSPSSGDSLHGLFYEATRERVEVSELSLSEAAVLWDGGDDPSKLPRGLPERCILASLDRATSAARAAGGALIFLGTSEEEAGVDDLSQEELLFSCMSLIKALARDSQKGLEIFFILTANQRYAALVGLLRSALHEHPELRFRLLVQEGGARVVLPALAGELIVTPEGVFAPRLSPSSPPSKVQSPPMYSRALVTGGLRGLGLALAEWLVSSGRAKSLVLVGRRLPVGDAARSVEELKKRVQTETMTCDVSSWAEVQKLPGDCDLVVHCAGNVKDGLLLNLTEEDARQVLRPKIRGSVHLKKHYPSAKIIAFSSSSGLFGTPGQSTYAAGNTFVDAVLPSVQWGGWGGVGMAEDLGIKELQGERFLSVSQGMECFGRVLDGAAMERRVPFSVLDVDWAIYRLMTTVFAPEEPLLAQIEALPKAPSVLGHPCEAFEDGDGNKRWKLVLGSAGARWKGAESVWEVCQQHVVHGVAMFPATGFIALALEAASLVLNSSQVQLLDITFVRPLELSSTRELTVTLTRSGTGGSLRFSSRMLQEPGEMQKSTAALHCTCSFALASGMVACSPDCKSLPEVKDLYARFAAAGYFYGPAFQGRKITADSSRACCELPSAPEELFSLDPGALDVAGQLLSLVHPLGCRGAPQGIKRLTARVGSKLRIGKTRLASTGQADVWALDEKSEIACHMEGLTFAALDAPAALTSCRQVWKQKEPKARGTWRVLGPEAKALGLSNTVEAEEEAHEAVVMAVRAKSLEDVKSVREEVRRVAAKTKCWLLSLDDEDGTYAEAAAEAAVEVGAQAVFGCAEDLCSIAPLLGVDTQVVLWAIDEDGGGPQLLMRATSAVEEPSTVIASKSQPYVATIDPSKASKGAQCRLTERRATPGKGEVEILASLWALNFRDVLVAVGAISTVVAGQSLGIGGECYGEVTAVGEGVTHVAVGDKVIAVPPDGMGSFLTTDARWVNKCPAGMTPAQAVAGTCVYATAWQALHWMGRMCRGERVLVHSAAGGVGLAAVHLCLKAGCEVYATASTPDKRKLLLSLGVAGVFNSRSVPDFESGIREATGGEGVDIVLNSLSGEAIPASLRLLRPFGRFVEIGKRDQYEDTKVGLNPFLGGISYCAAHFDVLMLRYPDRCRKLLEEVWAELPKLPYLPTKTYGMSDLSSALEYFSRGVHIGKVLVAVEDCPVLPARPTAVRGPDGDVVAQSLRLSLGAEDGPGGVLCVPSLRDLIVSDLSTTQLIFTASPAVASAVKVTNPDTSCILIPEWEPVGDIDNWLALGGQIQALEEEEGQGDLHEWLMEIVEEMAGPIGMDEKFEDAGLDSLNFISLARRLSSKVNKLVSVADLADHPTPRQLLESFSGKTQASPSRPRAVCLHGFRSNRDAMAYQMGPLVSAVGFVEWVFLNSPRAASGPPAPNIPQNEAREWWGQEGGSYEKGWMAPHFQGLQETLMEAQRLAPVGAVGFSQGGGVAALLNCAWVALFSPVVAQDMKSRQTPCFLSYDPAEEYVEQCKEVGSYFLQKETHTHGVGHDLPRDAAFIQLFVTFIASQVSGR